MLSKSKVMNAMPIKIQVDFLIEIERLILKFIWKAKGTRIAKIVLKKNTRVRVLTLPNFELA